MVNSFLLEELPDTLLKVMLRAGGAGLLDEVERSGTRRVQTARAWPRAAQHKWVACFNGAAFFNPLFFFFWFILQLFFKTRVALPEATPSRFALSSFRCAPLRPANQLRPWRNI